MTGCLGIAFLVLLPVLFLDVMGTAFIRLGITPEAVPLLIFFILLGSAVNVPLWSRVRHFEVPAQFPGLFGLYRLRPTALRLVHRQVVSLNVGGGLIPTGLSLYQLWRMAGEPVMLGAFAVVLVAVTGVAYRFSQVVPGVGIMMTPLLPAVTAAFLSLALVPKAAPPVAFSAGVLGVLVGADLLRLRQVLEAPVEEVSVGGAGTLDGVLIAGLAATLLA